MKSENVILSISLLFAAIMLGGLTVQSCRSSKTETRVHTSLDSVGSREYGREAERDSFLKVIHANKWSLNYQVEYYIPTVDSSGRVTGTALVRKEAMRYEREANKDSVAGVKERVKEKEKSEGAVKEVTDEESVKEKEATGVSCYIVLAVIIIFVLCVLFRKKICDKFRATFLF